jgi:hypothetical protein
LGSTSSEKKARGKRIAALERAIEGPGISDDRAVKQLKELMDLRIEDARYFSENKSRKPKLPPFRAR